MKKLIIIPVSLMAISFTSLGQKGNMTFFGDPILTDTSSTIFIPTRYSQEFSSSNKIAFWGDYYANFVIYNFEEDVYKKLFDKDVFIESFGARQYFSLQNGQKPKSKNITSNWVFLLVKIEDSNRSGRIDEKDASVLFAVSNKGKNLQQLTTTNENVISLENFEAQGFILIRIQKDTNDDRSFKSSDDKEYYFRKVNLSDLSFGNPIELWHVYLKI
ncbi:MAG: hypothetical protein RIC35_02880 [Marinoscillum sp.]